MTWMPRGPGVAFPWEYSRVGDWEFRVCKWGGSYTAEAKRGRFSQPGTCITEPGDCWFEFGASADEALSRLKKEVLR